MAGEEDGKRRLVDLRRMASPQVKRSERKKICVWIKFGLSQNILSEFSRQLSFVMYPLSGSSATGHMIGLHSGDLVRDHVLFVRQVEFDAPTR